MFEIFKGVIDERTLQNYCFALTGMSPLSKPIAVERQKEINEGWTPLGASTCLPTALDFDYAGKTQDSEDLIAFDLTEFATCKSATLRVTNLAKKTAISYAMDDVGYDDLFDKGRITKEDVVMAVEVAKWIVAKGLGYGRIVANDIVRRKRFQPRYPHLKP